MLEHDLGHERSALQIAAPLELEEVPLGAQDDVLLETVEERRPAAHSAYRSDP
jgi:hypothetical protein